jgi:hypothetical protein
MPALASVVGTMEGKNGARLSMLGRVTLVSKTVRT